MTEKYKGAITAICKFMGTKLGRSLLRTDRSVGQSFNEALTAGLVRLVRQRLSGDTHWAVRVRTDRLSKAQEAAKGAKTR